MNKETRSGYVAIVGRPNVGKSTLLNALLGQKLSITSRKPQTTRHRILGINTIDSVQIVYVDTPGLHVKQHRAMNRYMNRVAKAALHDVDMIVFVVEELRWNRDDAQVLKLLKDIECPVILVINKVDMIAKRERLLPYIESLSQRHSFYKILPVSAKKQIQTEELEKEIIACLPEGPHFFSPEQFTDRSDRFIASEIIREKLMRLLGQEIPYALTVTIDLVEEQEKIIRMSAVIWVEKSGQKAIVIGHQGSQLKKVGVDARRDLERYFEKQVYLQLWVKVKSDWSDDEKSLERFGYGD